MDIVKVLKRKDGSSVLVAVVLAFLVNNAVVAWAVRPTEWLSRDTVSGGGWKAAVWEPLVRLLVSLLVLEVVIRVYTLLVSGVGKK